MMPGASGKYMKTLLKKTRNSNSRAEALEKTKADLLASEKYLRIANDKTEDLSIKKLTKNAPSVRQMFDELDKGGNQLPEE